MAPFQVGIAPIKYHSSDIVKQFVDELYSTLRENGIEVLLDDRKERPGVMFADMDLMGIPNRLVMSEKGLDNGMVEFKARQQEKPEDIKVEHIVAHILERLQ